MGWAVGWAGLRDLHAMARTYLVSAGQTRSSGGEWCVGGNHKDGGSRLFRWDVDCRGIGEPAVEHELLGLNSHSTQPLQTLEELCEGKYAVEAHYAVKYSSGVAVLVDAAIPQLRLAFHVARPSEHTQRAGGPTASALVRQRLLRLVGWRLVMLPPAPRLAASSAAAAAAAAAGSRRLQQQPRAAAGGRGEEAAAAAAEQPAAQAEPDLRPAMRAFLCSQTKTLKALPGVAAQRLQPKPQLRRRNRPRRAP